VPDDRPRKLLERTPVPDDHKALLLDLVGRAQGLDPDLKPEFGPTHVSLITGCNQFVRLFRAGDAPGRVEMWLDDDAKQALRDAGFTLHEPEGAIFRMFGWVRIDPMEGGRAALEAALDAAFHKAQAKPKPA
jgi:hypothetical protein